MKDIFNPKKRKWAYRVALAISAILGVKGIIGKEELLYWNLLAAAFFGMADANVQVPENTEETDSYNYK